MHKTILKTLFSLLMVTLCTGCVGLIKVPEPFKRKPWTLLTEGDQFGRDQLANRSLVANDVIPLHGWYKNSIITTLGEPQEIKVTEREVSEDWYFVYYKKYKLAPRTDEGLFVVRFYHGKVIDVINLS